MRQNAFSSCPGLTAVLLTALLGGQSVFAQEMSLRPVYNTISGVRGLVWVAQETTLFTKHGVNVDLKYPAGNEEIGSLGDREVL
jgi:hypothetical protein